VQIVDAFIWHLTEYEYNIQLSVWAEENTNKMYCTGLKGQWQITQNGHEISSYKNYLQLLCILRKTMYYKRSRLGVKGQGHGVT